MGKAEMFYRHTGWNREPDNPRDSMEREEPIEPMMARSFIRDLEEGMFSRMTQIPDDEFEEQEDKYGHNRLPGMEKAKQYYGNETWQLLAGIVAACREWDESGKGIAELKEKYSGKFIEGVEIGERLAVYEARDFSFSVPEKDEASKSRTFTFTS